MRKQRIHFVVTVGLIVIGGVCVRLNGSDSETKPSEHEREISQLINILDMSNFEETEDLRQSELDKAIVDLAAMGDEVVDPLMEKVRRESDSSFQHRTVRVLREIGTPKAQEALLDIALARGPIKGTGSRWAALKYIETLHNKSDARKLLVSKRSDVLSDALLSLVGEPIDANLLGQLETSLESETWFLRLHAAMVMGADQSHMYAKEKVAAIVKSLGSIGQLPAAKQPFPNPLAVGTIEEHLYFRFADALSNMNGVDTHLQELTNKARSKTRWCIVMARARQGDSSVKTKLYKIIKDPNAGLLRSYAVSSLKHVGTLDDLPFLREIAETDPLVVERPHRCIVPPGEEGKLEKFYPVRFRARLVIEWIEKKSKEK